MRDFSRISDLQGVKKYKTDDKVLVGEILKGNQSALNYFYRHFKKPLFSFISQKIGNRQDAEEILQDTLLATLESLRDFAFRSSLFTFICSIASHKIIDFYRKKKIKKIVFSKFEEVEPLISHLFGPEEVYDEAILKSKIKETFEKLSPSYSLILKLKYVYGYTVTEIANIMSLSFKSAESTLFRARKAFVVNYEK